MDGVSERPVVFLSYMLVLFTAVVGIGLAAAEPQDMSDSYKVMPQQGSSSELERFASWFHQDWKLVYPDFEEGFKLYVADVSKSRRIVLARELRQFLDENKNASPQELKGLWLKLGAQAWQADLNMRDALERYYRALKEI